MVREFRGGPGPNMGRGEPMPRDVPGIGATKPAMEPQRITAALDDLAAGLGLNREEILEAINMRQQGRAPAQDKIEAFIGEHFGQQGSPQKTPIQRKKQQGSPQMTPIKRKRTEPVEDPRSMSPMPQQNRDRQPFW